MDYDLWVVRVEMERKYFEAGVVNSTLSLRSDVRQSLFIGNESFLNDEASEIIETWRKG